MHQYFEINQNENNICCKIYCQNKKDIKRIVIFCHGFVANKDYDAAEIFANQLLLKYEDAAVVSFDWPCHGDDEKKNLCLGDCNSYLNQVISWLKQEFQTEELYVYGASFGSYLTLKYISENGNPFRKIALCCPAVNMYDVLTKVIMTSDDFEKLEIVEAVPVGFDYKVPVGYAFLDELKKNGVQGMNYVDYAKNILIIHGTSDEIVPFDVVHAFAKNNSINFVPIADADHRFLDADKMEQVVQNILEFYEL